MSLVIAFSHQMNYWQTSGSINQDNIVSFYLQLFFAFICIIFILDWSRRSETDNPTKVGIYNIFVQTGFTFAYIIMFFFFYTVKRTVTKGFVVEYPL